MSNDTLPIHVFRKEIVDTVARSPVTIIVAETGAGKSTQVPQYLLEEGYNLVVTEPRRLAARTLAARVAEEENSELGDVIGYRTSQEKCDSPATRVLFCTDGLALVRELFGTNSRRDILVIDEVHEWNINIEVLLAWTKRELASGANFKVVIMSATLESEKLSRYFDGAPVMNVPGRLFPVEDRAPRMELVDEVAALAREGRNVLVFQPGKREIGETIQALTEMNLIAEILPLHGELTPDEQQRCFKHFGRPKVVVATNVAQTSVTIDDIDAVVDSGNERRIETIDGVEGLYLKPISLADREQRKGRAGRTKPGIYVDHCSAFTRPEFPTAEILRLRLDQVVLRLAEAGFDAEELDFFHQPDRSAIHIAKEALVSLGCMDENRRVTPMGHRIAKMPISVSYGRMIVEADELGVVGDVLSIAAILEAGEVTARNSEAWRSLIGNESTSDIMAQLAVYKASGALKSKEDFERAGVFRKAIFRVKEIRTHLAESLEGKVRSLSSSGDREKILRAVCSGMVDHLYHKSGVYGSYENGESGVSRELNRFSVIYGRPDWIVGLPFDLEITTKYGKKTLRLVRMATVVEPDWLLANVPSLGQKVKDRLELEKVKQEFARVQNRTYRYWFTPEQRAMMSPALMDKYDLLSRKAYESSRSTGAMRWWTHEMAEVLDQIDSERAAQVLAPRVEVSTRYLSFGGSLTSTVSRLFGTSPAPPRVPVVPKSTSFKHVGDRHLQCTNCPASDRLTKTEFLDWLHGKEIRKTCISCRLTGTVEKAG